MAKEIQFPNGTSGATNYYVNLVSPVGQWYKAGVGYQNYDEAQWANYKFGMTEFGTSGVFYLDLPASFPDGKHGYVVRQQAGGSPATSDPRVYAGSLDTVAGAVAVPGDVQLWKGTAPNGLGSGNDVLVEVNAWRGQTPAGTTGSGYIQTDVEYWRNAAVALNPVSGTPDVRLADSAAHGGTAASLQLSNFTTVQDFVVGQDFYVTRNFVAVNHVEFGGLIVDGNMDVGGNVAITGNLTAANYTGDAYAKLVDGSALVTLANGVTHGGSTAALSLANIQVNDFVSITNTVSLGAINCADYFFVGGVVRFFDDFTVSGSLNISDNMTVGADVVISGSITAHAFSFVNGTISSTFTVGNVVADNFTLNNNAHIFGNWTIDGNLTISGNTVFTGSVLATNAANDIRGIRVGSIVDGAITDAALSFTDDPTGPATGLLSRMNQLWRRFFKRRTKNRSGNGKVETFKNDGTTVATTQSYTDGTNQEVGDAS